MLSKRSDALISAFVLALYYVGVAAGNASDFVTMGDVRRSRRGQSHSSRPGGMIMEGVGFQYTMRFQPGFHLHNLAQQQGEGGGVDGMDGMGDGAVTEAPMPMPTPGTPPPEPATSEPEEPEPTIPTRPTSAPTEEPSPPSTDSMTMMPDPSTSPLPSAKPSVRPPVPTPPSSTMSSIMQPHQTLKKLLFGSPIEANLILKKPNAPRAKGKGFLSLFEVIKFPNTKCSVSMGDIRSMEGVCYHEFECKSLGGIPTESCAEGVGVCCVFVNGCGDVTSQQILYFESPNYPNAVREMMICVLIINVKKGVQQMRLDFQMFELSRPTNGDCVDDQFIVSGHNTNFQIPILCGINTGQHNFLQFIFMLVTQTRTKCISRYL
ncbi:swi5-dependent recombination DNA repair protein 1 homolog isoform X2 [Drosophila gunungcola]|uniref:swi5-dependent recombination DNA repair protein 1 homolog isoform X2 n=1 Tax=Drosophila gunungcola TaxID=103775 RepID=UPI0022E5B750|nr:swi5-dependent recombination DNA repair protein 1 homolog isoform X2 [Drosophila gunungcola]